MKTWILLRSAEVTNDDDDVNDTNDDDHCLGPGSTLSSSVTSLASSCRPGPDIYRQYAVTTLACDCGDWAAEDTQMT